MLSYSWLTDKTTDFEYKKYLLLDYFSKVNDKFNQIRLFPYIDDLTYHYKNLVDYLDTKHRMTNSFQNELVGVDWKNKKLLYESNVTDTSTSAIDRLVDYSLPKFTTLLNNGNELNELAKENVQLETVGVEPIYCNEGYILVDAPSQKAINVYEYRYSLLQHQSYENSLSTTLIHTYKNSLSNSVDRIKLKLIRNRSKLPNPATYYAYSNMFLPIQETVLPLVKQRLVDILSTKKGVE